MNYVFVFLLLISFISGIINGNINEVNESIFQGCKKTFDITIYLLGIMAFWTGILKVAERSGLIYVIAKIFKPIIKKLFNELPDKNDNVSCDISLNLTANAFGLSNAATPIGISAIKKMQKFNIDKTSASNSMCLLLAMNTAGFQIVPATVIAILASYNYKNPSEIIIPTFIVTSISFISAIILSKIFQKFYKPQNSNQIHKDTM